MPLRPTGPNTEGEKSGPLVKLVASVFLATKLLDHYINDRNHHDDSSIFSLGVVDQSVQRVIHTYTGMDNLSKVCIEIRDIVMDLSLSENLSAKAEVILCELLSNIFKHTDIRCGKNNHFNINIMIEYTSQLKIILTHTVQENNFFIDDINTFLPGMYSEGGYGIPMIKALCMDLDEFVSGDSHVTTITI